MTSTVAVFGASRADLYPLGPVLAALAAADDLAPVLIASGTTANREFGDPLAGLPLDGVRVVPVAADLGAADPAALVAGGLRIGAGVSEVLQELRPQALVVLGDRWELLFAVPPALLLGVPVVHLHGGEVTEGAIDDRIRHAVTKLADLHCTSTPAAADRLRRLGEPADRIVVTGAPSLDRLATTAPADDALLARRLGHAPVRPLALVTYHPVTAGGPDPATGARNVLEAVAARCGAALITAPGLDRGREAIVAEIERATAAHPHLVAVTALGADYLPVLAAADVVVGNSSSGVLEAASFGVPVVDVGDRQRGRDRGGNVLHAAEDPAAIEAALRTALTPQFRTAARGATNPYGDGHAAPRIVDVVRRAVAGGLARKPFAEAAS